MEELLRQLKEAGLGSIPGGVGGNPCGRRQRDRSLSRP